MGRKSLVDGWIVLGAGLLASSLSSFLERVALFGDATRFTRGFFDGLSVIAFAVAIFLLLRNRQVTPP